MNRIPQVVTYVKDTIIRKQFTTYLLKSVHNACCHLCQRYNNSKAIHNTPDCGACKQGVVTYVKDTIIRKQFTTTFDEGENVLMLSLMSKIQ